MTKPKYLGGMGFRDLELFNLALLARQAWRLLENPNSLSAKLLKAVYFPGTSILHAQLGSHPSQVWRAIVEGRDVLVQGLIRRIGDGTSTEIWNHNWLPRESSMRPITTANGNLFLVSELIDETSSRWREDLVRHTFLPMDSEVILGIPLCTRNVTDL